MKILKPVIICHSFEDKNLLWHLEKPSETDFQTSWEHLVQEIPLVPPRKTKEFYQENTTRMKTAPLSVLQFSIQLDSQQS